MDSIMLIFEVMKVEAEPLMTNGSAGDIAVTSPCRKTVVLNDPEYASSESTVREQNSHQQHLLGSKEVVQRKENYL